MFLPVLLTYTKNITNRATGTDYEVRGNALLIIDNETVEYFQIPTTTNIDIVLERNVRSYQYTRLDGSILTIRQHARSVPGTRSTYNIARLYRDSPKSNRITKNHSIRFPYFFNVWMIKSALGSMIRSHLPVYSRIDNRGGYFIIYGAEENYTMHWGTARVTESLGSTKNLDKVGWGELTVVQPIVPKHREPLIKLNN